MSTIVADKQVSERSFSPANESRKRGEKQEIEKTGTKTEGSFDITETADSFENISDSYTPSRGIRDSRNTEDEGRLSQLYNSFRKGLMSRGTGKAAPADTPPDTQAPATDFTRMVRNNFGTWDGDGDGYLSESEIDRAMTDSEIKGDDAAAVATLKAKRDTLEELSNDEWGDEDNGVTLGDLSELERLSEDSENKTAAGINGRFAYARQRINGASRELFPNKIPDPNSVEQGSIGDCYFLAAVASKARTNPQAIKDMITPHDDGTYTVDFPGHGSVTVSAPTDAEIAHFSGSGSDGLWLSVLEKGYGQLRNDRALLSTTDVPQDAADGGAALSEGINALTGHGTDTDDLWATKMSTTRDELESAMSDGRIVTAGIRGELPWEADQRSNGLPMGHAYSVVGYDRDSDIVTLRNPWGCAEPVDNQGRPVDGTDDGVFTMSLTQFNEYFSDISYEEAE